MNIKEHGKQFIQSLQELAHRSLWVWKRCHHGGSMDTIKHGTYTRHPVAIEKQLADQNDLDNPHRFLFS